MVSIQRTRGTRASVSRMAMVLGLESKKEKKETKEWSNSEVHVGGVDPPETNDPMIGIGSVGRAEG